MEGIFRLISRIVIFLLHYKSEQHWLELPLVRFYLWLVKNWVKFTF